MSTVPSQGAAGSCAASPWPGRPVLCIPLLGAHGATGVVHFLARSPVGLAAMPRALAETLVRLFAPALDNARLLRESIERSATDPLTGLANRRRLEEYAPKAIALSQRQGAPLSVIVLDLDRFKQINDRFGHDEGDRALTVVAKALQANVRATDLAARLGGDEFALLLPGSSAGEAAQVMERIREALAAGADARPYTLGVSAGIAEISPRSSTLRELLAHADRALYDAKRGRPWTSGGPLTANA
jgi:diguanylate cyclase (GGDEF)-like protein